MSSRAVTLVGLGSIGAITLVRAIVLASAGVPTGIDGGNWLAFGTLDRPGLAYPPVVPSVFSFLVGAVGPTLATVLLAAAAAAAPGIAILAVAWPVRQTIVGIFAATAAVASMAVGEAAAWGGYPQLLAISAAVAGLTAAAIYLAEGGRVALVSFAALFAGVVATSHLEAIPAAGAVAILAAWSWTTTGGRSARRPLVVLALAALPFVALAPLYTELLATREASVAGGLDLDRILGSGWLAYIFLLSLVPLALALAHRVRRSHGAAPRDLALLAAAAAAAVAWGGAYLVSGEVRLVHDVAVLAPFGAVALAVPAARVRAVRFGSVRLRSAGVAAVGVIAALGLAAFPAQVAYYRILDPSDVAALRWLAALPETSPTEVLVADVHGVPLGWWAEGIAGREVLFASDIRWLRFEAERTRARIANTILYGSGFPSATSSEVAAGAGVRYVVLPSASAFGLSADRVPAGWSVAFAEAGSVILSPTRVSALGAER